MTSMYARSKREKPTPAGRGFQDAPPSNTGGFENNLNPRGDKTSMESLIDYPTKRHSKFEIVLYVSMLILAPIAFVLTFIYFLSTKFN